MIPKGFVRWFLLFALANTFAFSAFAWLNDAVFAKYQWRAVRDLAHPIVTKELPRFDILQPAQWEEATGTLHKRWQVPARLLSVETLPATAAFREGFFESRVRYFWDFPEGAYAFMILNDKETVVEIGPFPGMLAVAVIDKLAGVLMWLAINGGVLYALFLGWQRRSAAIERATQAFLADGVARYIGDSADDALSGAAHSVNQMARQAEQLLRQRQQMIGDQRELLHAVAHECRAPLARVHFALEMLEHSESAPQRGKLARDMEVAIAEIDSLVRELLTYARLQHGAQHLALVECDLVSMVSEILRHTGDQYGSLNLQMQAPEPPVRPHADSRLLARVITNLVRNAACFAQATVTVSWHAEGEVFVLQVDDDGPGVPYEQRDRIFEPFARLDPSRSRDSGGMGLGLAIVLGISRRHQGQVFVADSPAGGARFVLRWPLHPREMMAAPVATSEERLH